MRALSEQESKAVDTARLRGKTGTAFQCRVSNNPAVFEHRHTDSCWQASL